MVVKYVPSSTMETTDFLQLQYCDACTAARGMYRVWVDRWYIDENGNGSSRDLVLCGHHFSAHESKILEFGYEVDEIE